MEPTTAAPAALTVYLAAKRAYDLAIEDARRESGWDFTRYMLLMAQARTAFAWMADFQDRWHAESNAVLASVRAA